MDVQKNTVRSQILKLLEGETHMNFLEAVAGFPLERINELPPGGDYSPWELLEHLRFTQRDILNFITDKNYEEPAWPKDYWPGKGKKADEKMWLKTLENFKKDLEALKKIAADKNTDFNFVISWGSGQTILEELLKVTDHNSYHLGEFAILRQVMGTWPLTRKS